MSMTRHIAVLIAGALALIALAIPALVSAGVSEARHGAFVGDSNHVTTGGVAPVREGDVWLVKLSADFSLDGAPDPKVSVSSDGSGPGVILAPLASKTGAQTYALPAGVDPSLIERVWIWCERFAVPLGHADLAA